MTCSIKINGKNINLDKKITLQEKSFIEDDGGGRTEDWVDKARCWCNIEPISATQVNWSQQLQHRVTHKIIVRYSSEIKINMRFLFSGRILHIVGFKNLMEENRYLEIETSEGSAS